MRFAISSVLQALLFAVLFLLPFPSLAGADAVAPSLAMNDNLGNQGPLPVVATGSGVYYPSGTYYFTETDLRVAARSLPIVWERSYRSNRVVKGGTGYQFAGPADSPLGFGWSSPYLVKIEGDAFVHADGRVIPFAKDANGNYLPNQEAGLVLQKTATGFELSKLGGETRLFTPEGKLTALRDSRGHEVTLRYDAQGALVAIADVMGREVLTFSHAAGRIARVTDLAGRSLEYSYDGFGNLERVLFEGTVVARYSYNAYHGMTSKSNALDETHTIEYAHADKGIVKNVIDPVGTALIYAGQSPAGHVTSFRYDFANRVFYVTDPAGTQSKYVLNAAGKVVAESRIVDGAEQPQETIAYLENRTTRSTDALGNVTLTQRDEWGNVTKKVDAAGFEWRFTYDAQGRLTSETDPLGTVHRYAYDAFGNRTQELRAAGTADESVTATTFDAFNAPTAIVKGGATTALRYDEAGNLVEVTDPLGQTTRMTYDLVGNLLTRTPPLLGTTRYEGYDRLGNPAKVTDPNGHVVTYSYDPLGRVKSASSSADNGVTRYEYGTTSGGSCTSCGGSGGTGKLAAVILPEGNRLDYAYDAVGNLIKITDSDGNTLNYRYDTRGNRQSEEIHDAAGVLHKTLTYQHDLLGRLTRTVNPDTSTTELGYDPRGNRTSLKTPNGALTTYAYDAANRLSKVTQPGDVITRYTYDRRGNLLSVTDAGNATTRYEYDKQDRLIKTTSPDTGITTYSYDPNGNLQSKTDAKGVTTTYTYDAANRLTAITFPDPADNVSYGYDACPNGLGRLCTMLDPSGVTTYAYTLKGQLANETKIIDGQSYVLGTGYDKNGNQTSLTYPSGRVVTTRYANDKPVAVLDNGVPVASTITYQPFGGLKSLTYGNGLPRTLNYDRQYRITAITTPGIQELVYSHDRNGNITTIADQLDPTKSKSYGYDALDRLTSATGPWGTLNYSYDGVGNRQTETTQGGSTAYSYQPNTNQLTSVTGEKAFAFSCDPNGNTTTENGKTFVYNQNQRLIKVIENGTTKGEYVYNGNGQRTQKTVAGQSTLYFHDPQGKLLAETGPNAADYLYLNGSPMAKAEGSTLYYYHTDHLGTPLRMTDQEKQTVWAGEFKPFGEAISITGPAINNLRFPGQYFDAETELHQNWHRDYDPKKGGYIEKDPFGIIKGTNPLYVYAKNNPIIIIDEYGLKCKVIGRNTETWFEESESIFYGDWIYKSTQQINIKCVCVYYRDKRIDITKTTYVKSIKILECTDKDRCGKETKYYDYEINTDRYLDKFSKYGGREWEKKYGTGFVTKGDIESGGGCDCEPYFPKPPGLYEE